jgi:hypothetical protein
MHSRALSSAFNSKKRKASAERAQKSVLKKVHLEKENLQTLDGDL